MGPLAGSVVAAICILNPKDFDANQISSPWFARVRDSKTIREPERITLEKVIKKNCLAYGIGESSVVEIDRLNIHHARLLAMRRAWKALVKNFPEHKKNKVIILIDGKFPIPDLEVVQETFVKGDSKIISIAAASILAKNYRDRKMILLDKKHPEYNFVQHKGYGTAKHIAVIKKIGPTAFHRKSFLKNIVPK